MHHRGEKANWHKFIALFILSATTKNTNKKCSQFVKIGLDLSEQTQWFQNWQIGKDDSFRTITRECIWYYVALQPFWARKRQRDKKARTTIFEFHVYNFTQRFFYCIKHINIGPLFFGLQIFLKSRILRQLLGWCGVKCGVKLNAWEIIKKITLLLKNLAF